MGMENSQQNSQHLNGLAKKKRKKLEVPLFKRKGQPYWYFYLRQDGRRVFKSTHKTTREEAHDAAREMMRKPKGSEMTFQDFAEDFFVWGKCKWIRAQHAAGKSFSVGAALGRRSHLTTWVFPKFGKRLLGSITPAELRDWLISLPLSGQSKNHLRYTLKTVFSEALFSELIDRNPAELVANVALNRKERDPFTLEDLSKLFPLDDAELLRIWGDQELATVMMVLASTGARSGEVRALFWRHYFPDRSALLIEQGVKFPFKDIGPTKTGERRVVYLRTRAKGMVDAWRAVCPWTDPGDLVFPSAVRGRPVDENILRNRLTRAMKRAGVEVAGRNLVPHSFRHGYVTRMKEVLPAALLQLTTGHKDEKVSRGYFHPSTEDYLRQLDGAGKLIEAAWTNEW